MDTGTERFWDEILHDLKDLERLRGELGLELHLMTMDMKTRWRDLERKMESLRNDAKMRTGTVARTYASELREEYRKLRGELGRKD